MLEMYDLWERHDREQEKWLETLPVCNMCRNPIQQDKAIYYNDQWICEECERDFWQEIREDFLVKVME